VIEELSGVSARESSQRPDGSGSLAVFVLDIDRKPTLAFEADSLLKQTALPPRRKSVATPTCGPIWPRSHRTASRSARQIQRSACG